LFERSSKEGTMSHVRDEMHIHSKILNHELKVFDDIVTALEIKIPDLVQNIEKLDKINEVLAEKIETLSAMFPPIYTRITKSSNHIVKANTKIAELECKLIISYMIFLN
jgi:predicted RNase H-like nuclease (RuvC/YqgF family)